MQVYIAYVVVSLALVIAIIVAILAKVEVTKLFKQAKNKLLECLYGNNDYCNLLKNINVKDGINPTDNQYSRLRKAMLVGLGKLSIKELRMLLFTYPHIIDSRYRYSPSLKSSIPQD